LTENSNNILIGKDLFIFKSLYVD